MGSIFVPSHVRQAIAADSTVGGGNGLETATRFSPDVHAPCLFAERSVRDAHGIPRDQLSLAELADLVGAWSAWYAGRGVGPRDRVGIYVQDSADDLIHYLALSRLGAIAVLINGELDPTIAVAYLRQTAPAGLQTDGARMARIADVLQPEADRFWVSSIGDTVPPGNVPVPPVFRHAADDPVLICHTSGTTGTPKPVIWAHGQMMVGIRAHLTRFRDHRQSLILSALPQSHGSAIGYALLAMLSGVPLVLMSDRSGRAVSTAAGRYRATIVVGFAATLAELALLDDAAGLDLVERWVSVGDASHQAHVTRLVQRGRHWVGTNPVPGSMFVDGFGSSELGWGGVLGSITIPGVAGPHRCLGVPQPFAEVAVLRPDGTPAEAGEVGLLGVKGATVTPGYWNDSDKTYRSQLNGYWLSGDLVFRDRADRFYHVDRAVDAIRTAGGMVYSVLTEEILLAHLPEITDCVVVAAERAGEVRAIALVHLRDGHGTDGMLNRANEVLNGLGRPPLADVQAVDVTSVPVGVTGKVLKRKLRPEHAAVTARSVAECVCRAE